jgi:hypothetical protein
MNKTPKYITPGLSPILRKYRTAEGHADVAEGDYDPYSTDTGILRGIFSENIFFRNTIWKSIIANKNICIHPYELAFIFSREYDIDQILENDMVQELNEAYLTYDYIEWYDKYIKTLNLGKFNTRGFFYQVMYTINNMQKITFLDCNKRFIVYPITQFEFRVNKSGNFNYGAHATFAIYDNNIQKAYFFDPHQFELEKYEEDLEKIDQINRIKIVKYKVLNILKTINPFLRIKDVEYVDTTAPQIISDDYNCLFWSLLLCDIIVKNLKEDEPFRPKLMIQSLLKKYNTKEKLLKVIGRYIGYVYEKAKAEANRKTGKFSIRKTGEIPRSFYRNVLKNVYVRKTQS